MTAPKLSPPNFTVEPTIVTWPATHYVFLEKVGPFQKTAPEAWQEVHKLIPLVAAHNQITGYTSLYKCKEQIYRAGVLLQTPPKTLPQGVRYEHFQGGKYSKFVWTGSYSALPQVSGRVFEIVAERKVPLRDDFYIENYANDPRTTPEDQLITEILVPTA